MGSRNQRTARRFQVEALEGRLAPGGRGGLGGDFRWAHVAPRQADVAPPGGGAVARPESAPVACGSNTVRAGEEGNATPVACGSKPGIMSGSNSILYGQETNADRVACGSKPGVASGSI